MPIRGVPKLDGDELIFNLTIKCSVVVNIDKPYCETARVAGTAEQLASVADARLSSIWLIQTRFDAKIAGLMPVAAQERLVPPAQAAEDAGLSD
jgi:hypothetical protein